MIKQIGILEERCERSSFELLQFHDDEISDSLRVYFIDFDYVHNECSLWKQFL